MQQSTKEKVFIIFTGLFAFVLALLLFEYIGSLFSVNSTDKKLNEINENITSIKSQLTDYSAKDLMQKSVIVSDFSNTVKAGGPDNMIRKNITVKGPIKNGYLYVKASVNGAKLSSFDSVYLKLVHNEEDNNISAGGHLRRDKSLDVPGSDKNTELLYKLDNVFYKIGIPYSEQVDALSSDFLKILNSNNSNQVISFLSTLREGHIQEISIFYECLDKSSCEIRVQ